MSENVENVEHTEVIETKVDTATLSQEQEIGALRKVHQFLNEFDRVPGSMSASWSQMLDTIAIVANSLIAKMPKESAETQEELTQN